MALQCHDEPLENVKSYHITLRFARVGVAWQTLQLVGFGVRAQWWKDFPNQVIRRYEASTQLQTQESFQFRHGDTIIPNESKFLPRQTWSKCRFISFCRFFNCNVFFLFLLWQLSLAQASAARRYFRLGHFAGLEHRCSIDTSKQMLHMPSQVKSSQCIQSVAGSAILAFGHPRLASG